MPAGAPLRSLSDWFEWYTTYSANYSLINQSTFNFTPSAGILDYFSNKLKTGSLWEEFYVLLAGVFIANISRSFLMIVVSP